MRPDPNPNYTPPPTATLGTLRETLASAERQRNDCSIFLDINRDTFLTLDAELRTHESEIAALAVRIAHAEKAERFATLVHLARLVHRRSSANAQGVLIVGEVQQVYARYACRGTKPYTVINSFGNGSSYATPDELFLDWKLA